MNIPPILVIYKYNLLDIYVFFLNIYYLAMSKRFNTCSKVKTRSVQLSTSNSFDWIGVYFQSSQLTHTLPEAFEEEINANTLPKYSGTY